MSNKKEMATAAKYRKSVSKPLIKVSGGMHFQVRTLDFMEFMSIAEALQAEFPDQVTTENLFAVATNTEFPEAMWAYAKRALPVTVLKPKLIAEPMDGSKDLAVTELAPMDVINLNMASMMGNPRVRELMTSFRKGEPVSGDGDAAGATDEHETE